MEEGEDKFKRVLTQHRSNSRFSVAKSFKRNKMNFEIFDDIFDMEQARINRNFHESEHD